MSKSWTGGSTPEWRDIRAFVLRRDRYRCRVKLDGCTTIATTAHHTLVLATVSWAWLVVATRCANRG